MNKVVFSSVFLIFCLLLIFSYLSGCSGGFNDDSPNASDFRSAVFGSDTLR